MTCIIIEDEIPAQNIIKRFIGKIPSLKLIGVFKAAIEANSVLNAPPAIVITTAYPEFAVPSFELDTIVDYLVKPFSFDRFLKAVNKSKIRLEASKVNTEHSEETVYLNVDKTFHKLVLNHICYIESERNYVTIVTENKKLSFIDSLKNWVEKLPEHQFIQVHKSFIVNAKMVDKISGNTLFINSNKIPIGRTYKQELLTKLGV